MTLPRWPVSISTFFSHSVSVYGAQPIFAEIDRIADQRLSRRPSPFKTFHTARSRTSGIYLFVHLFMMLHPTQELEPPANELWLNLGDAHHQAAQFSVSLVTSTPLLNLIPSITFGN